MAIAVSLAASLAYRQQVSIRLAGNLGALEQAYQYATGMEDWAGVILSNDLKKNNKDSLDEDWATVIPPIPIPGGHMKGQLFDLQARININDLLVVVKKNGQIKKIVSPLQKQRLSQLFLKLGLPEKELVDNLLDWLDPDEQERDNGAESGHYKTLQPSYLSANSSLLSLSELRLIKGYNEAIEKDQNDEAAIEETIFQKISPYVSALPVKGKGININVNTASSDILYSLGLDEIQVKNVIEDRETKAFGDINEFTGGLGLQNPKKFPKDRLSVDSQYFLLQGIVEIGRVRVFINSTIHRDSTGRTRVIHREFNQT